MADFLSKDKVIFYLIALLMGGGGNTLSQFINDPRPDPFTGSQGAELHALVDANNDKIARLQTNQKVLMNWFYQAHKNGTYQQPRGPTQ